MSASPAAKRYLPSGRLLLLLSVLMAVLGAKLQLIDRYGSDLPYWDQWDAEGDFLLRPHLEGKLTAAELYRPHNEHRPAISRLLSLALFEAGGRQWDARVQMLVNSLLHASIACFLLALAWRALPPLATAGFAALTALFLSTPVSWENTLSGFQSQFYFVLLFAALHLGGTLLAPPRSWRWCLAPLAGTAALFSMASGLLSALAIVGAVAARALRDRKITRDDLLVLGINAVLVVSGLWLKTAVPGHEELKASGPGVWIEAFLHQFSWPVISLWAAPLGLLPPVALALAYFRRRIDGPVALTLLGASTWFCLQAAAIAYARGSEAHGYASRYCDILSVGVLINVLSLAYLAATALSRRGRIGGIGLAAVFTGIALGGLSREADKTFQETLRILPDINDARISKVRGYVESHDPSFFNAAPWTELPYPSATRLASLLDNPALRAALPASVRPPLSLAADPGGTQHFAVDSIVGDAPGPAPSELPTWLGSPDTNARFLSLPFELRHSRLTLFVSCDGSSNNQLHLVDDQRRSHAPLGPLADGPRWKRVNFSVAPGVYQLEASHDGPGWLAFTAPTTTTPLSNLALKAMRLGPWLLGASTLLGFAALVRFGIPAGPAAPSRRDAWSALVPLFLGLAVIAVLLGRLGLVSGSSPPDEPVPSPGQRVTDFALVDPAAPAVPGAKFTGAAFLVPGNTAEWFGTYVGGDAFTGSVVSTDFLLEGVSLGIPILGYPNSPGNELALEVIEAGGHPVATLSYDRSNPREAPGMWNPRIAGWRGHTARLRLVDGQTGPGGWLAVGTPRFGDFVGPSFLDAVPRNHGWFGLSAVACAALLFLPGLALRTWWPKTLPPGAIFLPLPGLFLLAAGGLLIWVAGPAALDIPAGLWLAVHALLAGALMVRWWTQGGPLETSETASLGVYGCVVIGALAFGILPLDVAQEWDGRSTGQSRMIASPPDHMIPYRSAAYILHQKDGREDRNVYFGDDWSVASRGPIAPLAIAASFAIWDEHPSDPPDYLLESWPATRDSFYLARIGGVLMNALVVLAGAALASRLNPGAGRIALVWLSVSPVVAINTDFLWPKLLATFFVALAVLAALERRSPGRIALWSALAYFSHPVGGLFMPPLLLFLAQRTWTADLGSTGARTRHVLSDAAAFCGVILACLAPWFIFKAWVGHPDVFLHYPLGDGRGFDHAKSLLTWLQCRFDNFWLTLVPGGFFASGHMRMWIEGSINEPLRWAIGYAKTLPGALGFAAFAVAAFALLRRPSSAATGFRRHLLFGGFALMLAFWGFSSDGLGRNCLEPLAVLLIVYTAAAIRPGWPGWRWLLLLTVMEALSVRFIGVVFAPSFSRSSVDAAAIGLSALTVLASLAPAVWFVLRPTARP